MSDGNYHDERGFWPGFFLGGLLGAALIFLLGTKEGKKIAQDLQEKGEELAADLEGKIEDVQKNAEDLKEDVAGETMEKLDSALAKLEEAQVKAQETTENFRKRYFTKSGKKLS